MMAHRTNVKMFTFSEQHAWQGDSAVQQILVFPNLGQKLAFEDAFAKNLTAYGIDSAEDTGIGAIYKLRAIKNADGTYGAMIRCGVTAECLWDAYSYDRTKTPEEALQKCVERLKEHIASSLTTLSFSIS